MTHDETASDGKDQEITISEVTVSKVLKADGRYVVRYNTADGGESYMDTLSMLNFAAAMVTERAMREGEEDR